MFPNGVPKATKCPATNLDTKHFPRMNPDIIAIDFGTSTLAAAYSTQRDRVPQILRFHENLNYVPTVLLIKRDDEENKMVTEIGQRALHQYSTFAVDLSTSVFFHKVKLELQHDEVLKLCVCVCVCVCIICILYSMLIGPIYKI